MVTEMETTDGAMAHGYGSLSWFSQYSEVGVTASDGVATMVVMVILVLHRQMLEPQ